MELVKLYYYNILFNICKIKHNTSTLTENKFNKTEECPQKLITISIIFLCENFKAMK